jgi:acyl-CoA thioesterase I
MSARKQRILACLKRAAAATVFIAVHIAALRTAAQAQIPNEIPSQLPVSTLFVAPEATPVAASAATPSPIPAVGLPGARANSADALKRAFAMPPASAAPSSQIVCRAPPEFTHFDHPLVHTMRRLAAGKPLTIVAIGSSSTAGAGATSRAASYPNQLAATLNARFPDQAITVLNRGVNGEETDDMMARFATDVIAAQPQLVLWQVGTNSVLRDHSLDTHAAELHKGIEELKATGADIVLIDPQYAPKVLAKSEAPGMVEQIALAAKEENIDLFRRFAVMRDWYTVQHLGFDVFVSPDKLHMNDWGYGCWAKLIGAAIADAATRPITSAAAHSAH